MAEVNVWGVIRVTKASLPLIRKYQGRIVNVVSMLGRSPVTYSSAYFITKQALEAYTDIFRLEMARFKVGVFTIEPGHFTEATAIVMNAMEDALIRRYPKSRYFVVSFLDKTIAHFYQFFPTFIYDFITLKANDIFQSHIASYKKQ